jgi:type VI secretion system secreted protein VgrG
MNIGHIWKFNFCIMDTEYEIAVEDFEAKEFISEPFVLTINLVSEDEISLNDVVIREAVLTIIGKSEDRYIHGIISNFMLTGSNGRFYSYQATVVPSMWMLNFNKNFRIFQHASVVDIVTKILDENRIPSDEYVFKLASDYPERRYCTQYGESDFRFICRILEEEGIFFFFEHSEDSHTIVFSDTEMIYTPIVGDSDVSFHHDSGLVAETEAIDSFAYNRAICPGKITHTNYNFKRPSLGMEVVEKGDTHTVHEIYEYPGDYGLPPEGSAKVRAHLDGVKALEESVQGTSNCARFIPGSTFTISDHSFEQLNKEYCLVSVEHEGSQPNVYGEYSGIGGDYTYSNHFIAIPASTIYRTSKTLTKPFVRGLQSAIVVGPPGYEIYTDEFGRIKVQFHWDREGRKDGADSCWLRTSQPWSGNGWGMVSLPRIGDEVLVAFVNGDPDWPIMVGCVNNAASPALYSLPDNKSQSGIRTRSTPGGGCDNFNELRFEDKFGSEEVYLQGERDWNILIKNDKGQTVARDETLAVGNNRSKKVGRNQTEEIGVNHTETIGANKTETVAIDKSETIGAVKKLTIGGLYQVTVGADMNETVGAAKMEEVVGAKVVIVGAHMSESVIGTRSIDTGKTHSLKAQKVLVEAADEIVFSTGSASISMKSNGNIVISGNNIQVKGNGNITVKGQKVTTNG